MKRHPKQRGSAMLEFVLAGVPMIFAWVSIVQMAIGMWQYHTLQFAVKAAGQYVAHHGAGYVKSGNSARTIADAAAVLKNTAIGIPASSIQATFTSGATTVTCYLNACNSNTTTWPPTANSAEGTEFTVKANWVFRPAIAMYGPGGRPLQFGSNQLAGYTRQFVIF